MLKAGVEPNSPLFGCNWTSMIGFLQLLLNTSLVCVEDGDFCQSVSRLHPWKAGSFGFTYMDTHALVSVMLSYLLSDSAKHKDPILILCGAKTLTLWHQVWIQGSFGQIHDGCSGPSWEAWNRRMRPWGTFCAIFFTCESCEHCLKKLSIIEPAFENLSSSGVVCHFLVLLTWTLEMSKRD